MARSRPVYSALVSVRLTITVRQAAFLNAAAKTLGVSKAEVMRRFLEDACDFWIEKGAYSHPPMATMRPRYPALNDGHSRV